MDMGTIILIPILVGLVCLSAFFSASETAYSSASVIKLKNLASEGNKKAIKAVKLEENFDRLLTAILVGNNIVNVGSSTLCTLLFTIYMGASWGTVAATLFMVTVLLIFGEITPKTLAKKNAERYAMKFATMLDIIITILSPLVWVFLKLTNLISRRAKDDSAEAVTLTEDELYFMIDEIEEEGTLEKSESELIKSAIEFDDIKVSQIYTPRVDIVAADIRASADDLRILFSEHMYSRIPIYDQTIDRIVGAVYAKEFYSKYVDNRDVMITDLIKPVKFVPENMSIATLLNDLQKTKIHMAVVLDSFGGTVGIVCMEDILEELVGDIWDESDEVNYPLVKETDGSYTVLGEANIYDVTKDLNIDFNPDPDFDELTVGGYICFMLKKIPRKGDKVELDGADLTVSTMKSRRIKDVRLTFREKKADAESNSEETD